MIVSISYLERPVTEEEREIAQLLERMTLLIKSNDLEALKNLYRYDADLSGMSETINATARENRYIESIRKLYTKTRKLIFKDVLIRVKNNAEATVFLTRAVLFTDSLQHHISLRTLELQKDQGQWYIIYS